jgi:hypothetical protein
MGELKKWLDQEWVRIDSEGNIAGSCGTSKDTKMPDRCLPKKKAQGMTKEERKATAQKKKRGQKKGKKVVANTKAGKVTGMRDGGGVNSRIARGCGAVLSDRRKQTKYY